jgi:hypothetical protein
MTAAAHITLFALLVLGPGGQSTQANVEEAAPLNWVRALFQNDVEAISRSTRLPFEFRTTTRDNRCEGRIRTKRALRKWMACINAREDMRMFEKRLSIPECFVGAGPAQQYEDSYSGDRLAIKLAGVKAWPKWHTVTTAFMYRSSILLLDTGGHGAFSVEAMIYDEGKF